MSFINTMHVYFRGEKLEALWFILPIGIVLVILGVVSLKAERGGFAWGVAVPCFLFGLILIGTGAGVALRTAGRITAIERDFERMPANLVKKELPRMQNVNAIFRLTFYAFGILAVLGLAIHYLVGEWGRGFGSALILIGAIGLLVDGFAERRAAPYTSALEELAEQHQNSQ